MSYDPYPDWMAERAAREFDARYEPRFCPGCGNFTLGDGGVCNREACSYGKEDDDEGTGARV